MTGHMTYNLKSWDWIPSFIIKNPWLQFPWRGGNASVLMFSWISRYTTTHKLCGLMQMKQSDQFLKSLISTTFRRYMSLFLPPIPVVLLTAIAVKTHVISAPKAAHDVICTGNVFWFWDKDTARILDPFGPVNSYWVGDRGCRLIQPTWSLRTEFRSNMMTYSFCTATFRLSTKVRKRLILSILPSFLFWNAPSSFMAFLGMWFTELCQEKRLQGRTPARQLPRTSQQPEILLNGHDLPENQKAHAPAFSESDGELDLISRISGPT